jgi:hypothetical protein
MYFMQRQQRATSNNDLDVDLGFATVTLPAFTSARSKVVVPIETTAATTCDHIATYYSLAASGAPVCGNWRGRRIRGSFSGDWYAMGLHTTAAAASAKIA